MVLDDDQPQIDGLVERFNQTLKRMFKKAVSQDGRDWDLLIPYVLFASPGVPGLHRVFPLGVIFCSGASGAPRHGMGGLGPPTLPLSLGY